MESKLNKSVIEKRADDFSGKICADFFLKKEIIKGEEIGGLTSIPQINGFVFKALLQKWRKEVDNLKSPYFDYSNKSVDNALNSFMNVLSHNISVRADDFKPILKQATLESLLIYLSPLDFFLDEIGDLKNLKLNELKYQEKFYKVNNHLYAAIVSEFELLNSKDELNKISVQAILNKVFEEFSGTPDDFDWFLKEFNKTTEFNIDDVYSEEGFTKDVNSDFTENTVSINDYHTDTSKSKLVDTLHNYSGKKLGELLSVNQRFMFTIELFKGDKESFEKAVKFLDESLNEKSATEYLETEGIARKWDKETSEVVEFYQLVSKKFKSSE